MGRMFIRMIWIALLIFLGVQIGVHQAEKRQSVVAQADMNPNEAASSKSFVTRAIEGSGISSVIKGTGAGSNVKGMVQTGSTLTGSTGANETTLAGAAGYEEEERVAESFINRLGNKLGELLHMLVSSLIGLLAGFLKSILN